jgi:hypothetical protein
MTVVERAWWKEVNLIHTPSSIASNKPTTKGVPVMSKSLSVKVQVSMLISALEKSLAERKKRYETQELETAKYEKAVANYNLTVLKLIKAGKGTIEEVTRNHWQDRHSKVKGKSTFSVTVLLPTGTLPAEPEAVSDYHEHEYKRDYEAISQAIRVLKMTDQEYVNASTYKSVAEYL